MRDYPYDGVAAEYVTRTYNAHRRVDLNIGNEAVASALWFYVVNDSDFDGGDTDVVFDEYPIVDEVYKLVIAEERAASLITY